ncbi:neurofilament heavy polypeptide-like [Achroia grisella]|uniref:neurofilament heavy polypeptide-like n=1 Tax=Achroia grisella TaxID=688607 RepID=UPI0027D2D127|nr:neurofilament heavy polypeptide-like [Achroia grisella]
MDLEAIKPKNKKQQAASTNAPKQRPSKAASQDAPKRPIIKVASFDAPGHSTGDAPSKAASEEPTRKGTEQDALPQAASSDVPSSSSKDAPCKAASQEMMRKATDRYAPTKAASRGVPTTSSKDALEEAASGDTPKKVTERNAPTQAAFRKVPVASTKDAPRKAAPTSLPKIVAAPGEPKKGSLHDAPNKAASTSEPSEVNLAALFKVESEEMSVSAASGTESDNQAMDLTSLKDAIQSPSKPKQPGNTLIKPKSASKKRRMKARAKAAAQRAEAVDAARHQLGSCPATTKPKGEASTSGPSAPATGTRAVLAAGTQKRSMKPRGRKKPRTNDPKTRQDRKSVHVQKTPSHQPGKVKNPEPLVRRVGVL